MQDIYLEDDSKTRETLIDNLTNKSGSAREMYQEIYVGEKSLVELFKYELLTGLSSPIPGALGFVLRKVFYKLLFAKVGRGLVVGPHVTLRCPGKISLGENVFIDSNVVLDAKGKASKIRSGDSILIGKDTILSCASAVITLGDEISIGPYCYIRAGHASIEIGSYVTIGSHATIISGGPSYQRMDIPIMKQVGSTKGVMLGDDVWIGVGARIIDGVNVGSGSVIGAGAVVIEDVPEFAVVAGVPARIIRYRNQ